MSLCLLLLYHLHLMQIQAAFLTIELDQVAKFNNEINPDNSKSSSGMIFRVIFYLLSLTRKEDATSSRAMI